MKIYARQISPDYQESPLYLFPDCFPDKIAVCGNRYYTEQKCEVFARVQKTLEAGELADVLEDFKTCGRSEWYKNVTEAINDLLPAEKRKYSARDIHALKQLVPMFGTYDHEKDTLCRVLGVVTGKAWDYKIIRGAVQAEWNEVFYQVDEWSPAALERFEVEYFNTGSEWIIHDGDDAPEDPEEITGPCVYCVAWDNDGIREEIAREAGARPEDVILYAFKQYRWIPEYEKIDF